MASPHMMCPSCVGHGKFRDNTPCTLCKGSGSVTVAAGRKFIAADHEEPSSEKASTVGANNKGGSSSRASRKKARKAGNVSARQGKAESETERLAESAVVE